MWKAYLFEGVVQLAHFAFWLTLFALAISVLLLNSADMTVFRYVGF